MRPLLAAAFAIFAGTLGAQDPANETEVAPPSSSSVQDRRGCVAI